MRLGTLGLVGSAALVAWLGLRAPSGPRPRTATAEPPSLVLVSTVGRATESSVLVFDQTGLGPIGTVAHRAEAGLRATVMQGAILVAVDVGAEADRSYGATLFAVEAGRTRALVDRLAHASRPLVAPDGEIWVSRGVAGVDRDGARRIDELSLETLDLAGGPSRPRFAATGWELHLAGLVGGEAVGYLKDQSGAQLVAVGAPGRTRILLPSLSRAARDFTVDGRGRLVFADVDGAGWAVVRFDPASGVRERLLTSVSDHLAPFAWPAGDEVAFSQAGRDGDDGLALVGRGLHRPAGPGVDVVRAVSRDGLWLALWHYRAGAIEPDVVVAPVAGGSARVLVPPDGTHFEIAGFAVSP